MTTLQFNEIWQYLHQVRLNSFTLYTPWSVPTVEQSFLRRRLVFYDLNVKGFRFNCYETSTQSLDSLLYKSERFPCRDLFAVLLEYYTLGYTEMDLKSTLAIYQKRLPNLALKLLLTCYRHRLKIIESVNVPALVATSLADTQEELISALHIEPEYGYLIYKYPMSLNPQDRVKSIQQRGQALQMFLKKHDELLMQKFIKPLAITSHVSTSFNPPPLTYGSKKSSLQRL